MPQKGEIFKNPQLANTLKTIAKKGREGFYEGPIAQTMAEFVQSQGGFLSYDDLAGFHSEWTPPVSTNYRGYDVWELPPNGQGIAALQILNILENYDLKGMGLYSSEYIHLFAEVKKIVDKGYERARKVLSDKIDDLHKLAKALLIYETLSGDEIRDLILKDIKPTRSFRDENEDDGKASSALGSLGLKPKPAV